MPRKTRPNYGNIITLTLAFAAVAGVTKCTNWAFFEESQTDNIYRIVEIDTETSVSGHGLVKAVDASIDYSDRWQNADDQDWFLFDLSEFPPKHDAGRRLLSPFNQRQQI